MRGPAVLAASLLLLAACGREEPPPPPPDTSAAQAEAQAEGLFASACSGLGMDATVCSCIRGRVAAAAGTQGLGYVGAAYGQDPTQVGPYEDAMSQDARNDAAEAFLNGQFECAVAANPALTVAPAEPDVVPPNAAGDLAESPFEQAVAACFETGSASEPACRCRVQAAFDALGEDGLTLALADAIGDTGTMAALANRRGGEWLDRGQNALGYARTTCGG